MSEMIIEQMINVITCGAIGMLLKDRTIHAPQNKLSTFYNSIIVI